MSIKLFDLTGKVALVTGSNRGLGFSMAKGLAAAGAKIVINGRSQDGVDEGIKKLKAEGLSAAGAIFDVTKPKDIAVAVKKVEENVGPIDILVNNAGINKRAPCTRWRRACGARWWTPISAVPTSRPAPSSTA